MERNTEPGGSCILLQHVKMREKKEKLQIYEPLTLIKLHFTENPVSLINSHFDPKRNRFKLK